MTESIDDGDELKQFADANFRIHNYYLTRVGAWGQGGVGLLLRRLAPPLDHGAKG